MIRHLAELAALLLCFAVGVGLFAVVGIVLLMIWHPEFTITAGEDEYRRVENKGTVIPVSPPACICVEDGWGYDLFDPLAATPCPVHSPEYFEVAITSPRPYNWATREPMVWSDAKG